MAFVEAECSPLCHKVQLRLISKERGSDFAHINLCKQFTVRGVDYIRSKHTRNCCTELTIDKVEEYMSDQKEKRKKKKTSATTRIFGLLVPKVRTSPTCF